MILGTGIDIIEISRIKKMYESEHFMNRFFTEAEREYLSGRRLESTAGYFCAKEAAVKALGTGFSGFNFKDVEVVKINSVPTIRLHNNALEIARQKGIENMHLSISHCIEYATAFVVAEGRLDMEMELQV